VTGAEKLLHVGLWSAVWCAGHSLFVTHWWRDTVRRLFPRWHVFSRAVYVTSSTVSLGALFLWLRTLPETTLFAWEGIWSWLRWLGLAEAAFLFWAGARAYDNRRFLGLTQVVEYMAGRPAADPPFRTDGILGVVRHPWYGGTLIFLVFCLPWTDVNLVWRSVFLAYTLIGCELEERKLLRELGDVYADYRRQVPRYFPRLAPRRPGPPAV
jgi:protein-S-isoprenylcysteine O-methyltransferase Ste14